jgi:hypothetical protein
MRIGVSEDGMENNSLWKKIISWFRKLGKSLADFKEYRERQRERFVEINEIKDWSKGEGYFGNGRLF